MKDPNLLLTYDRTFAAVVGIFTNTWHTATDERLRDVIAKISQITGLAESEQPRVFAELREMATLLGRRAAL